MHPINTPSPLSWPAYNIHSVSPAPIFLDQPLKSCSVHSSPQPHSFLIALISSIWQTEKEQILLQIKLRTVLLYEGGRRGEGGGKRERGEKREEKRARKKSRKEEKRKREKSQGGKFEPNFCRNVKICKRLHTL